MYTHTHIYTHTKETVCDVIIARIEIPIQDLRMDEINRKETYRSRTGERVGRTVKQAVCYAERLWVKFSSAPLRMHLLFHLWVGERLLALPSSLAFLRAH